MPTEIERGRVRQLERKGERYAEVQVLIHGALYDRLEAARRKVGLRFPLDRFIAEILESHVAAQSIESDAKTCRAPSGNGPASWAPPNWP